MKSHNKDKLLKELESMPLETLSVVQQKELDFLQKTKRLMEEGMTSIKGGSKHYDRKGKEMSLWEWSCYFEDYEYKIVAVHKFGEYKVSTVWLGVDHNYHFEGFPETPIAIFETMIFNDDDKEDELSGYMERYATEEEALAGHLEACKLASNLSNDNWLTKTKIKNRFGI